MDIQVIRRWKSETATISEVTVDGKFQCYFLEDIDRGIDQSMPLEQVRALKVKAATAIPTGRYPVSITYSPAFKRMLPLISQVPGFDGIRIHSGNTSLHTEGCPLTGKAFDLIGRDYQIRGGTSRPAFDELYTKIQAALKTGASVFITIKRDFEEAA
ncbi:hypothetical protein SAMN05216327_101183 [Dyadobacter sp. SG02]|uniref:DUF5675 family protein n=1 Tax=Dyadobacter sp. SG02 TaxID=1855291 RepID=UPI0008CAB27F|nr:DUF5675 family protein [Dyadobacter sp. SG02]SEI39304.1 hypothetical protein SAMN05216327_101183 [Dyadobacter sp. SG02]